MKPFNRIRCTLLPALALLFCAGNAAAQTRPTARAAELRLKDGWAIHSSDGVAGTGEGISRAGFDTKGWYGASVPSTVLAALVENKVYPDPYFGMNLRAVPGTTYKIGENFSNVAMSSNSPFRVSWWYRTEFQLPESYDRKNVWLNFKGINYRANVWMNGQKLAGTDKVVGAFRQYEFNVTQYGKPGKANAVAVEVFAPEPNDLAITWVDWNPAPPDKNMGLWGPVTLEASGPVAVRHSQVITKFDLPALDVAHLTVSAEVENPTDQAVRGRLEGAIESAHFSQEVQLQPHETRMLQFTPDKFPELNMKHPRVWWPYRLGEANLYDLSLDFTVNGEISDRQALRFGMDQITSELTPQGALLFRVNGKRILVRGGGWAPDMMLRQSPERLEAEFRYTRDMNLNTLRLEGKMESDEFFALADRMGILIMPGWACCDHWEKWKDWKGDERAVAAASLRDQALRLRNHPSVLVWLNGSDNHPPGDVEQIYLNVLKEANWPKPILSSASQAPAKVTGPSGVKMTGPYDYVPAVYWLSDKKSGGAFGFNTETSPGAAIPPIESLREMLPQDHLWPIDDFWNYHAGGGQFKNLKLYTKALEKRYGAASSLEDYVWKSQAMAYEGERAMFEAFGRNKYESTGVIQWMMNNAWPSLIWHLYDYYLRPAGGYFGTKIACEPLHIQYSYDDHSIDVVNEYQRAFPGIKFTVKIYDLNGTEKFSHEGSVDIPPDSGTGVFALPAIPGLGTAYFLKLTLADSAGKLFSSNFYWLSSKADELDWNSTQWWGTLQKSYADFSGLSKLPKMELKIASEAGQRGADGFSIVHVENPTSHVAFLVRLKVERGPNGEEILPVLWEDNYFTLLPGEKRDIRASYRWADLHGFTPVVRVDGWNASGAQ